MSFDISPWHGHVEYSSLEAQATYKRFHGKTYLTHRELETQSTRKADGSTACEFNIFYLLETAFLNEMIE